VEKPSRAKGTSRKNSQQGGTRDRRRDGARATRGEGYTGEYEAGEKTKKKKNRKEKIT